MKVDDLIGAREGSEEAKRKAALLLRELQGELSMGEVAKALGVNEAMAYKLREQLLLGAIEGLEPKHVGRPAKVVSEEGKRVEELQVELKAQKRELKAAHLREEILLRIPEIGRRGKKKPSS